MTKAEYEKKLAQQKRFEERQRESARRYQAKRESKAKAGKITPIKSKPKNRGAYKDVYFDFVLEKFGIDKHEILCEVTGAKAVDLHHIEGRGRRKDLEFEITNIIAVTRAVHLHFGDKTAYKDWLKKVHRNFMETGQSWIVENSDCQFLQIFQKINKDF